MTTREHIVHEEIPDSKHEDVIWQKVIEHHHNPHHTGMYFEGQLTDGTDDA